MIDGISYYYFWICGANSLILCVYEIMETVYCGVSLLIFFVCKIVGTVYFLIRPWIQSMIMPMQWWT